MHMSLVLICEIAIIRSVVCIYYCVLVFCLALKTKLDQLHIEKSAQLRFNSTNTFECSYCLCCFHLAVFTLPSTLSRHRLGNHQRRLPLIHPCVSRLSHWPQMRCAGLLCCTGPNIVSQVSTDGCHKKVCILFKAFKPPLTGSNPNNQSCNGKAMRLEKSVVSWIDYSRGVRWTEHGGAIFTSLVCSEDKSSFQSN